MVRFLLYFAAAALVLLVDRLDEWCSRAGVVSFLHGAAVGAGMIWCSRWLFLRLTGAAPDWTIAPAALVLLLFSGWLRFRATGTRWVFALNFGKLVGVLAATWYLL